MSSIVPPFEYFHPLLYTYRKKRIPPKDEIPPNTNRRKNKIWETGVESLEIKIPFGALMFTAIPA